MKIKLYSVVIIILILFSNCSKDDELELLDPEIIFVHQDGTIVIDGECINQDEQYALQITIKSKGGGSFKNKKVDFTVNGIVKSVVFTELGARTIPITFIDGINTVQLQETGVTTSLEVKLNCKATISANKIEFVFADGSAIPTNECLDLSKNYAVKIASIIEVEGVLENTKIEYTLNGAVQSVTFSDAGTQIISVSLKAGENIVQLSDSGISAKLDLVESCNATILADAISFVFADGSVIPEGICLDLNTEYAIKISTKVVGDGSIESTKIEYTINGIDHSTTFIGAGTQIISVTLKTGENTARLSENGISANLSLVESCNATILADAISFVYADGSIIPDGTCLDLSNEYAVKISTQVEGNGPIESTKIEYTINGILQSVTFTNAGIKVIAVTLKTGENTAQLSDTGISTKLNLVESCNAVLLASSISFVYENGSEINASCLDINLKYAVKIETTVEGDGPIKSTNIEYTINGILYSMEFSEGGTKINPINIKEGENIAQIIGINLESRINFVAQGEFQLVE